MEILRFLMRKWMFWLSLTIPYLLRLLFSFNYKSYKEFGRKIAIKRVFYSVVLPIFVVGGFLKFMDYYKNSEAFNYTWNHKVENTTAVVGQQYKVDGKQRGMHVFGRIDSTSTTPLIKNNFEWITIVPFMGMEDYDSPTIRSRRKSRRNPNKRMDSIWIDKINFAHQQGFRVMLKPHIWISNSSGGKWRSDIFPKSDTDWQAWSISYREEILFYAKIAALTNVELFCIGTELTRLTKEKSKFWIQLIKEVRTIYEGEITYAANWYEEYDKISFWDHLDYIGVQAYFPLSENDNPSLREIKKGWKKHIKSLKTVNEKFNKPILFTELGYKSTSDSAITPWEWVDFPYASTKKISYKTQVACYQAFFETVWPKDWFAGAHIWEWNSRRTEEKEGKDPGFTPQFKPALNTIAIGFKE